jgi:FlaG/FlaF family flagellin (archaellin)
MKKIILASVVAVSAVSSMSGAMAASSATASAVCAGSAGSGTQVTADTATFVKTAFSPKCSANVHLAGQDGGTYYRVGSTNTKGGRAWMGSSAGLCARHGRTLAGESPAVS